MDAQQRRGGSGDTMAGALSCQAGHWEVVPRPVIGGSAEHPIRTDLALLHPDRGIALVDLAPRATFHAAASLRQILDAAQLEARYPGQLPVVYHRLAPEEVPLVPRLLEAAFATEPPLTVANTAWMASVRTLLLTGPPRPAKADAKAGTWSGTALAIAMLLLLAVGGGAVTFGLLGLPATPPRSDAVADATSLLETETPRPSATESLSATPGPQPAAVQGLSQAPQNLLPEAATNPATAAPAAAALAVPAPAPGFRVVIAPTTTPTSPAGAVQTAAPPISSEPASASEQDTSLAAFGFTAPLPAFPSTAPESPAGPHLDALPGMGPLPIPSPSSGAHLIGRERSQAGPVSDMQRLEAILPSPPAPAPTTLGRRGSPATQAMSPVPHSATAAVAVPRQPASPRCAAILARLQLGEAPSHADRSHLQTFCAPRS